MNFPLYTAYIPILLFTYTSLPGHAVEEREISPRISDRLISASSRITKPQRERISQKLRLLEHLHYASYRIIFGTDPHISLDSDDINAAIQPLSPRFPDAEKLILYAITASINQNAEMLRKMNTAMADSLFMLCSKIRMATGKPLKNPYANNYIFLLIRRLEHLELYQTSLYSLFGKRNPELPKLRSVESIDSVDEFVEYLLKFIERETVLAEYIYRALKQ